MDVLEATTSPFSVEKILLVNEIMAGLWNLNFHIVVKEKRQITIDRSALNYPLTSIFSAFLQGYL